jgi:predicted dienelactone hydrolase
MKLNGKSQPTLYAVMPALSCSCCPWLPTLVLATVGIFAAPLAAESIPIDWKSEGTFEVTGFPRGTAVNTFSTSAPLELNDVHFSHTVEPRDDGSLRLFGGTFEIAANNGDLLRGTYEDFIYEAPDEVGTYFGSGPFAIVGGTGQFAGHTGSGSWNATARFTSDVGGTADHEWQGSITPSADPHGLGPFAIGHRLVEIPRGRASHISVDVWYPVDAAKAMGNLASYKTLPGLNFEIPSPVAIDSAPVSDQGAFPLVIYFHGGIGYGAMNSSLSESLASHGFVVAGPHQWTNAKTIIEHFQSQNMDPAAPLAGAIDASNVGLVGLSAGADATVQNAGRDDRIKAAMPISTSVAGGNDVDVPTLLLTGTQDFLRGSTESFFRTASATPRYLGVIQGAGHVSFADWCDRLDYARANGAEAAFTNLYAQFSGDGCTERHIPNERGIELTNRYAVSFFNTYLAGQAQYADFLTPEYTGSGELEVAFYAIQTQLQAGDADQDLDFDQFDLIKVQQAGKYLSGTRATWGEGDWNAAPGGGPGFPPAGDRRFNQLDIVAAQQGALYLTGTYAAVPTGGQAGDGQTSILYDAGTGELAVDAPAGAELTSINIDSAAGIFTGTAAQNLGGSFDNDSDNNIFKATFGSSFGSLSFGNVAQTGLSEAFVLSDLTVVGSLAGGGALGDVDLIYVPEPSTVTLTVLGVLGLLRYARPRRESGTA